MMKVIFNNKISRVSCIVLYLLFACGISLQYSGCSSVQTITEKSQLRDPEGTGEIVVLTKESKKYTLENYTVKDSVLTGEGTLEVGEMQVPFKGPLPLSDISYIQTSSSSTGNTLVGIGMSIFVTGIAASLAGATPSLTPGAGVTGYTHPVTYSSCPFVYTYDGNDYNFESETFAGAVIKTAERKSYDDLYYLKPVNGEYTLKLTNERPETEYNNDIKLHIIDAPPGCAVIPDGKGVIHTIGSHIAPIACIDMDGKDQLSKISVRDSNFWESDLAQKDFDRNSDLRDGLILKFPKPSDARTMKVIVAGGNTTLGVFAFRKLFTMEGGNILRWYQALETDTADAGRFIRFMKRVGMLHVSVWEHGGWVEQTSIPDVGPMIVKDQVALLNVADVSADTVMVKIESATDLWRIDNVYADYSPDMPVQDRTLVPTSAIDNAGRDVTALLNRADDSYYATMPGQYAYLKFPEVSAVPGKQRFYVLESQGYYHQWYDEGKQDQSKVIDRIIDDPAFGSRLLLSAWKTARVASAQ